jgi:hypothetical protein
MPERTPGNRFKDDNIRQNEDESWMFQGDELTRAGLRILLQSSPVHVIVALSS